jgi:hypothetical protein
MPLKTKPRELGAPLPTEDYAGPLEHHLPSDEAINDELDRAKVELMHAVAKHRKAWSKMRRHKLAAEMKSVWAEAYTPYKEAVSDVRWWREEMNAQATVVIALTSMQYPE